MDSDKNQYSEALSYLYSQLPMFSRIGAAAYKPGLDTSIALDNYFGNPHKRFKSIHVGGTNGKGSCSHTIAAMLIAQGYKTGLYTSPHLVDFRERIRINGEMILKEEVVDFVDRWKKCDYPGHPSFFELTMMMAFDWFAKSNIDIAVIEVGMGGRLDSTNIITPEACIITNISIDHRQFLGDTPAEIAGEKAGIIKHGIPVTIGEAEDVVKEVFEKRASEVDAPIRFAPEERFLKSCVRSRAGGWDCTATHVCPESEHKLTEFRMELGGEYQRANINTILSAVDMLRRCGIEISEDAEKTGFEKVCDITGLAGRWMKLSDTPLTICDTGHNEAGITYNMRQLSHELAQLPEESIIHMVLGFVSDKEVSHILNLLPRKRVKYYITQASVPRAMPLATLQDNFKSAGLSATPIGNVCDAYNTALQSASKDDIIFVGGSTFIVADLLADLQSN